MMRGVRCLIPLVLLATGACFATREDVQALHADVQSLRSDNARSDSARRAALDRVVTSLNIVRDSLGLLSTRVVKMQGDVRGDLYNVGQQLLQIQELTGQSQQRVQELRAALEARQSDIQSSTAPSNVSPPPGATGAAAGATTPPSGVSPSTRPGATPPPAPSGATPGPNQLFQMSLEQLRRGSPGAARTGLQTLLQQYPTSDLVPDAQFYLGEAYHQEGNAAGADSAYAAVVAGHPTSPRAPTALYKRALGMEEKGNIVGARGLLNDLVTRYPRSDEAALAKERLRTLK